MDDAIWYYAKGDRQTGPVTWAAMQELAATGQLVPGDLVWRVGVPTWYAASLVDGLFPTAGGAATAAETAGASPTGATPPPPPIGERAFDPSLAGSGAKPFADRATKVAQTAAEDAWAALKLLIANPVGGLPTAYEQLGPNRGMQAGIAFGVTFYACFVVGTTLAMLRFHGAVLGLGGLPGVSGFSGFLKLVIVGALPLLGMTCGIMVTRAACRGKGSHESDLFIAGASLLPMGAYVLLAGILGAANMEVTAILMVLAACLTILMLYSGCTRICAVAEPAATLAVPLIIVVSLWVSQIVLRV